MSEENNGSGNTSANEKKQPGINILGQYIKDLSFENPRAPASLRSSGENPNLQVNFNVLAHPHGDDTYEVSLKIEANAKSDDGSIYTMELVYAGMFKLNEMPEQAIKPVLFIECPALLFPFTRRLIADLTREGGFPPLLLDPIDFAALFRQRVAQEKATAEATAQ
jgi:preprotein translocase subunit SecB